MQTLMVAEGRRLELDIDRLNRTLPSVARPCGLRQRAKSAFIKQLHAYKCERLETVQYELGRDAARAMENAQHARRN